MSRKHGIAVLFAALAALALPASALAATVGVEEFPGATNQVKVSFLADPAEANDLTVDVVSEDEEFYALRLLDSGAAIQPGAGCSGGGAPGVAVECKVHRPAPGKDYVCFKGCMFKLGTRWEVSIGFRLGDGGSRLDTTALPAGAREPQQAWSPEVPLTTTVTAGSGNDTVLTGPGPDLIEASQGNDFVRTGNGADSFRGGPVPDGADDVEFGDPTYASIDYSERAEGVTITANGLAEDGARGEGDNLGPAAALTGGAGDDTLVASSGAEPRYGSRLYGGAGDDLLRGGPRSDEIYGGEGDDSYFGEAGEDRLAEASPYRSEEESGNDTASGGEGEDQIELGKGDDEASGDGENDAIELGPGSDLAAAGEGDDLVRGGPGDDTIRGEAGNDRLSGDTGRDTLLGGDGSDWIAAGMSVTETYAKRRAFLDEPGPLEGKPDRVGCGAGRDGVKLGRGDSAQGCELRLHAQLMEVLAIVQPTYPGGETTIRYTVRRAGAISLRGPGIRARKNRFDQPETWAFKVVPTAAEAGRRGHPTVRVRIVFAPARGRDEVRELTLTLWQAANLSPRHPA